MGVKHPFLQTSGLISCINMQLVGPEVCSNEFLIPIPFYFRIANSHSHNCDFRFTGQFLQHHQQTSLSSLSMVLIKLASVHTIRYDMNIFVYVQKLKSSQLSLTHRTLK